MTWFVRYGRHDGAGGPIIDDFDTFDDALDFALTIDDEPNGYWRDPIEDDQE